MNRSSEASQRLDLLRFPLIVAVLFIHGYETQVNFARDSAGADHTGLVNVFVRNLFSQNIARVAVPLFFLISGYLFFEGVAWSLLAYKKKLRSRIRSLLIPYLFWNGLTLLLFALGQNLPATARYFSGDEPRILHNDALWYLSAMFGIGRYPVSFQFWFIRDLMLLVLAAPVFALLRGWRGVVCVGVLASLWLFDWGPTYLPSIEATLFFAVGCAVALNRKGLFELDPYGPRLLILYVPALLIGAATFGSEPGRYVHKIVVLLGVPSVLYLTLLAHRSLGTRNALLALASSSFFVFAAHEPSMQLYRKILFRAVPPRTDGLVLVLYFLVPLSLAFLLVWIYRLLILIAPKATRAITGGR